MNKINIFLFIYFILTVKNNYKMLKQKKKKKLVGARFLYELYININYFHIMIIL